ncbi:hypothetical protein [Runella limosa]|uniref:hypothetical protein n=1 Tax=Runella limosa TaxID=370978 RepID=UPI00040E24B3|nr:hypothetical protein [Runella limosa]
MKLFFTILLFIPIALSLNAQVITPNTISFPKKSYEEINQFTSPTRGDAIFDTTFNVLRVYNGIKWMALGVDEKNPVMAAWRGGGLFSDIGEDIVVDKNNNIYVVGIFNLTAIFDSLSIVAPDTSALFLAKYSKTGKILWVKQVASNTGIGANVSRLCLSSTGELLIAGVFRDSVNFGIETLSASTGKAEGFVAKFSSEGLPLWVRRINSTNSLLIYDLGLDRNDNLYVVGTFFDSATFENTTLTSVGSSDFFLASYTSEGAFRWVRQGGSEGNNFDSCRGVAISSQNQIYITGTFVGKFSIGNKILETLGNQNMYLARYSSNGDFVSVFQAHGNVNNLRGNVEGVRVIATNRDDIYVAGRFQATAALGDYKLIGNLNTYQVFLARFSETNVVAAFETQGDFLGGVSLTADDDGAVYLAGGFIGNAIIKSFVPKIISSAGGFDFFVAKYANNYPAEWVISGGGKNSDVISNMAIGQNKNIYLTGQYVGESIIGNTRLKNANSLTDMFFIRLVQP